MLRRFCLFFVLTNKKYIGTRQLEALFNLSQLLFGLARAEQSNYTFRDLQLGQSARRFHDQSIILQFFNCLSTMF